MKLIGIDVFDCNTPFKNGYPSPHILRMRAESIVIKIRFDNDISGYGESAPRAYVTGEDPESVAGMVRDHFSSLLLGSEIRSVSDIETLLCALEDECRAHAISSYLSALGAVDIALLDGLSKTLEVPFSSLLGPIVREDVTYTLPIPLLPLDLIREIPGYLRGTRIDSIKVLMEESVPRNMARLEAVRSIFGPDMEISIEANGKWTYQQAVDNLDQLKEYTVAAVEQPLHSTDLEGLRKIREMTGIPVMVDESMCTLSDAQLLIGSGACDMLNIKISKCGGVLRSKEIADFALSKGVRFQLGTHVGETDILNRAGINLAVVSPNVIHFEGFSSLLFETLRDEKDLVEDMSDQNALEASRSVVNIASQSLTMIHSFNL